MERYSIISEIENDVFSRYNNNGLPINIIDLAKKYDINTFIFPKEEVNVDYLSTLLAADTMPKVLLEKKGISEDSFLLCLITDDALEQRLLTAYNLAILLLYTNGKIEDEDLKRKLSVKRIDTNSDEYYLALALLCPKDKVFDMLDKNGHTLKKCKDISDYSKYTQAFLVSSYDFMNRLRFLEEGELIR